MRVIPDKLILLLFGCLLLTTEPLSVVSVAALLTAVTLSAVNGVLMRKWFAAAASLGYVLLCVWRTEFIGFLPLIFYDVVLFAAWPWIFAAVIPVVTVEGAFDQSLVRTGMTLLFLGLAALLCSRTVALNTLRQELLRQRDRGREEALLLESRNRNLMDKQEYEIRLATLGERNRIAREIHDNVGHMLSRSILQVGALMAINKENTMKAGLDGLHDTLSNAMDSIRRSVHDLHDESIDLSTQIEKLVREFSYCPVRVDYDIESAMDRPLKYTLLSIIREALSNIARHSQATQASITLREHPALYQLVIQDNGKGGGSSGGSGIGLRNMADRVAAYRGQFHIQDQPGFKIFISIPKEAPAHEYSHR